MAISTTDLHRFTVEQFEQMSEFGVLPERGVELVDGLVVALSARGDRHGYAVSVLTELFVDQRAGRYAVNPENLTLQLGPAMRASPISCSRGVRAVTRTNARDPRTSRSSSRSPIVARVRFGTEEDRLRAQRDSGVLGRRHSAPPRPRVSRREPLWRAYLHESLHGADETIAPAEFPDAVVPVARILGLDA